MIVLADPLTKLIGGTVGYSNANAVLIALASLMITYSLSFIIYTQVLIPTKKEKLYLYVLIGGVLLNIMFSLLFGLVAFKNNPAFGVALGTAITDALMLIALLVITWEHSKTIVISKNNLKLLAISAILVGLTIVLNKFININAETLEQSLLIKLVVIFLIDLATYLVSAFITKEKLVKSFFKKA